MFGNTQAREKKVPSSHQIKYKKKDNLFQLQYHDPFQKVNRFSEPNKYIDEQLKMSTVSIKS